MSETHLVKACLVWLHLHQIMAWRNNTGAMTIRGRGQRSRFVRFGQTGASDIFGILPGGRFLAVECKVGRNVPTPAQWQFLQDVRAARALAGVVYSVGELAELVGSP